MIKVDGLKTELEGSAGILVFEVSLAARALSDNVDRGTTLLLASGILNMIKITDEELEEIQRMRKEDEENE